MEHHLKIRQAQQELNSQYLPINNSQRSGMYGDVLIGFHRSTFSKANVEFNSDLVPCDLWTFLTMKTELRGKKFRSDQRPAARFREVGGVL
jgi:hypothetical protein